MLERVVRLEADARKSVLQFDCSLAVVWLRSKLLFMTCGVRCEHLLFPWRIGKIENSVRQNGWSYVGSRRLEDRTLRREKRPSAPG